jgi:hypothetical protein
MSKSFSGIMPPTITGIFVMFFVFNKFVNWFKNLPEEDQDELMKMVYSEYKVRDVVRSFSAMPAVQRQTVFQRLGLPDELLTKIPAPGANDAGELEVEWQEWNA